MNLCKGMANSTPQDKSSGVVGGTTTTTPPPPPTTKPARKPSLISRLRKRFNLYHRDRHATAAAAAAGATPPPTAPPEATTTTPPQGAPTTPANPRGTGKRRVVPGLPRQPTLQRMQSEKRERLRPYEPPHQERRAHSANRNPPLAGSAAVAAAATAKASSRSLQPIPSQSITSVVSDVEATRAQEDAVRRRNEPVSPGSMLDVPPLAQKKEERAKEEAGRTEEKKVVGGGEELALQLAERSPKESEPQIISASEEGLSDSDSDSWTQKGDDSSSRGMSKEIEEEMEWRWILNLSMHFRDESNREKFFVTYAQRRDLRRRITISCDYRNAEEGTLEKDLSRLKFQRDKSAKIYKAIRDSLQDIMFYDTITNLKLQSSDGRLHVHVTEDINEIIPYPPIMAIQHLRCPKYRECDLEFDSHLSGFVYKVGVKGDIMIKKEIPGPDTVDEFLYEINALYALADSDHVIQFGGCVVDDTRQRVKGLLISFASQGALIDILFNQRGKLPWARREKWAKQIVSGLSEIHEAGYVQGDFTLSNIVIDADDNAKIIDINRRGCPVGWEPPEITAMIEGLQRIGMYIGVKSDVFQLGMVLWGIAHEMDEPEAMARPLTMDQAPDDVPAYFREIVEGCLCDRPQGRPSAKDIIALFPETIIEEASPQQQPGDGRPLPGTTPQNGDGYFPPAASSRQNSRHTLLNGENLESLPREPVSPTAQVIEAAPSISEFSNEDGSGGGGVPNHLVSSLASLVGGVGLEDREFSASRASGVAIPPEEYTALLLADSPGMEYDKSSTTGTVRRVGCGGTPNGNGNGNGHATTTTSHEKCENQEWRPAGVATPATEILQFEDAKESFTPSPTEELGTPPPPNLGVALRA